LRKFLIFDKELVGFLLKLFDENIFFGFDLPQIYSLELDMRKYIVVN